MNKLTEAQLEDITLTWFQDLGYTCLHGPDLAPDEPAAERESYHDVILTGRLRDALARLNPDLPADALDEALRRVSHPDTPALIGSNRAFHRMLVHGVPIEYRRPDDTIAGEQVWLLDFDHPESNDWLVLNQYTVIDGQHNRRPDLVLFVNGLPLALIELKNPADEEATVWAAFNQVQTYKQEVPALFTTNEALVISDGLTARIGTLTSDMERFMPWRTIAGDQAPASQLELEVLVRGVFAPARFLDLLRSFIVFEDEGDETIVKKMAGYHQYHAVNRALAETLAASQPTGLRRGGVVWHTQGSGKSLTMAFYAGKVIMQPQMQNPTLLVITDRNDLDDQLFATFSRCHELLRQSPVQASDRDNLRELLRVASGGVVFTTIQKFLPDESGERYPLLSERRNIIVIADEAHRTQYGFRAKVDPKTGEKSYGFAQHVRDALPNASFIGFTGTPVELTDRNTRQVFGDYISIYDIQQAVQDGATVPIYYESRLAKLALDEQERPHLDEEFDEATEGEEITQKEKLKSKWAALEAIVGSARRIRLIAEDIVQHYEQRLDVMEGKAMIVCMIRRICIDLYNELVQLRPDWQADDDQQGVLKVVMTGAAADPLDWQQHIRSKPRREALAKRFKNPDDPLRIVIVRDMWLTGFDAPSLHTMYVDKPMRGHGLMQAIARVNRVFRDKPGGLVVDYLGLADQLKQALAIYTESGGHGTTAQDQSETAVPIMLEKHEICCNLFHGFDWSCWSTGTPAERLALLPAAQEHILQQEDGRARLMQVVLELSRAFALATPHEEALRIRDDVSFFQTVRVALAKQTTAQQQQSAENLDQAIRQIVSRAIVSDEVIDIFATAGLNKPDISILSEEFLADVRGLPHKNLAVEMLRRLLTDEVKSRARTNLVQSRSFAAMLDQSIRAYQNRAIEAAQVIEELIVLAKEMREADQRGEDLGMSEDELAFYDALAMNGSAVEVLGDDTLRQIARELVEAVRQNLTIDWTVKESIQSKLRVIIKRLLRKHGYPPDKQEQATNTVLQQAALFGGKWAV
jgi:type I restriction enzyme R subunit